MKSHPKPRFLLILFACLCGTVVQAQQRPGKEKLNLVLLTLDTTRPDVLGSYGATHQKSPYLDSVGINGTLYLSAVSPSPLTLPAHASLMTGKTPLGHGVRTNGTAALSGEAVTLAEVLAEAGYTTAAFIASQVLDRRFGLAQGFGFYADEINAADMGESGYPERNADGVVTDALAWLERRPPEPFFIWLHFYDPHSPYDPQGGDPNRPPRDRYADEVAQMDRAIGRLLRAIPKQNTMVAAVADHGEMLGEHGEQTHGIFLYQGSMHVPMMIKGPGVPKARIAETVGSERLPATLLHLLGFAEQAKSFGTPLPGFPFSPDKKNIPVYSEAQMPLTAYGWSPLAAITQGTYRFISAPHPELYDLADDPEEVKNLIREQRDLTRSMRDQLLAMERETPKTQPDTVDRDPHMAASLRSLGYISGAARPEDDGIDPKEGIRLLADFAKSKDLLSHGQYKQARTLLQGLIDRNPSNIPFLTRLAEAHMHLNEQQEALALYRRAVSLNPHLDFLHLNLGAALRIAGDFKAAQASLEMATRINPRSAKGWLHLAEVVNLQGDLEAEHGILHHSLKHGVASATLLARLAQVEMKYKKWEQANRALEAATLLEPGLTVAWLLWGDLAEAQGEIRLALQRYSQAARYNPDDPTVYTRVGRIYVRSGDHANARKYLQIAVKKGADTPVGRDAAAMLETLPKP